MLHPNAYPLVKIIHDQRVAEALQRQRHRPLREPRLNVLARLLLNLGNRLVALGAKFNTDTVASPAEPAVG